MVEIIPNWHPLLVHFTIALLITAVGLYVLSVVLKTHKWQEQWLVVANWNLWLGSGITILTALAGLYAYNTVAHDTPSHEAMTIHRNWAIGTVVAVFVLAIWSIIRYRARKKTSVPFLILALVVGGLLMTTGWHGAEVVYRYGLGVMSLPKSEGEGHAHEHADGEGHGDMATNDHEDDSHGHSNADDHHQDATNDGHHDSSSPQDSHDVMSSDDHHDASTADDHHDNASDDHGHNGEKGELHTHADGTVERH